MRSPSDPDRFGAIERAVTALLSACGLDLQHKDLVGTPARVARVWSAEFLSGFAMDPAEILGDPVEGEGASELVVVRGLPFHGLCPHHLLPYIGSASVAYLPDNRLAGFGRLGDLVTCFTRRLTLQERAACITRARHTCLSVPDNKHGAEVVTSSLRGELRTRPDLQALLFA